MRFHALWHISHRLAIGASGRCPHCARGRLFASRFRLRETCAYCDVRFARAHGEMMGAMYVNSTLTLALALLGFFVTETRFHLPLLHQLVLWSAFCIAFPLLAFRPAQGLWVAVAYLTGGVYADPDYEREWISPRRSPAPTRRQPWAGD